MKPVSENLVINPGVAKEIWRLYRIAKEGQVVTIRSGYGLCGVYNYSKEHPRDYSRSESDAEHDYGCFMLAINILNLCPWMIPNPSDRLYALQCLAIHELGENEIGDIPDDGERNDAEKDAIELSYVKSYVNSWSEPHKQKVLELFANMRSKDTLLQEFVLLVDKTEALLQNIIYELQNRPASLDARLKNTGHLSVRDEKAMSTIKTSSVVDCWAYGFCNKYHEYRLFDIFFTIVREAVKDARGKDFDWFSLAPPSSIPES